MNMYDKYVAEMKRLKASPPYMTEKQLYELLGMHQQEIAPLLIIPKRDTSPVAPTFKNYEKVTKPKKIKAVSVPRVPMTDEERRLRRNQTQRERMALIRPKKQRKTLTDEDKREYKRNYMKKWREDNPRSQTEANLKWRKENPELNKMRRREESRRRRAREKEKLKQSMAQ